MQMHFGLKAYSSPIITVFLLSEAVRRIRVSLDELRLCNLQPDSMLDGVWELRQGEEDESR